MPVPGSEGTQPRPEKLVSHSQDSEPGQLLAHPWWEQPDACAGQGPAGRTETELAPGPGPCHPQPPISSSRSATDMEALTEVKWEVQGG